MISLSIEMLRRRLMKVIEELELDSEQLPRETLTLLNFPVSNDVITKQKVTALGKTLKEAIKLQRMFEYVVFIKTLSLVPYCHIDVDVIVPYNRIPEVSRYLRNAGYVFHSKSPHSFLYVKSDVQIDLHYKIGVDGLRYIKAEEIMTTTLLHEVYNRLIGEEFPFRVPNLEYQRIICLMNILTNKFVRIQDVFELALLGLKTETLEHLLSLSSGQSFPKKISINTMINILKQISSKTTPEIDLRYVAKHIFHFGKLRFGLLPIEK